ncbi:anti-sigma factor [Solitalea longa]|uniref:Anti-sigma factor n=1 Tax=Solitalea longa TaxID=2079460 RepID=A0A2S4ZXC5_9SPHI|nr:FecR domain-containing protein [Solitalea longa]POY34699.1 anti-sigma factor [Solitalea longa]
MDQQYAKELLEKYKSGQCTAEEKEQVENWITFGEFPDAEISLEELEDQLDAMSNALPLYKERRLWPKIAVAAAAAIVIFSVGLIYYSGQSNKSKQTTIAFNDIAPGKQGATLTLANGSQIRLSTASNGEIAQQSNVKITKSAKGEIIYQLGSSKNDQSATNSLNTLTTANGEVYTLILPDNSKVWMNAASSISYTPMLMDKGVRRVRLEGEAYFEVVKDKAHPFIVESAGQKVEVLGTHFNVNAYSDESSVITTLLEGSVRVTSEKNGISAKNVMLKPNQQSVTAANIIHVSEVNTREAVAWKNGLFYFNNTAIQNVMRQVERWYDVKVVYEQPALKDEILSGSVSRYGNLSKLLAAIEQTGAVKFKIEGKVIKVTQ